MQKRLVGRKYSFATGGTGPELTRSPSDNGETQLHGDRSYSIFCVWALEAGARSARRGMSGLSLSLAVSLPSVRHCLAKLESEALNPAYGILSVLKSGSVPVYLRSRSKTVRLSALVNTAP